MKAFLSRHEFDDAIEELADVSHKINETNPWTVVNDNGAKYLVKRNDMKELACNDDTAVQRRNDDDDDDADADDADDDDVGQLLLEDDDPAALHVATTQCAVLVYEWHVCYSVSYQAPAIYFRVFQLGNTSEQLLE
jgi:hypothetical protein